MVAITGKKGKSKQDEIPDYLVYETLEGMPVYYRGYKNVLNGKQTFEEIIGYGALQIFLINLLKDYFQPLFGKDHWIWTGDRGFAGFRCERSDLDVYTGGKSDGRPSRSALVDGQLDR